MADKRVIQDSDESDGGMSDSAASIDPLQELSSAGLRASKRVGPEDTGEDVALYRESQPKSPHPAKHRDSGDIMIDFDSFLVSPNQNSQHVTASQQAREELWISRPAKDGRTAGITEGDRAQPSQLTTSRPDPPYSAISPSKIMLKRGKTMTAFNDGGHEDSNPTKFPKRRKTTGARDYTFSNMASEFTFADRGATPYDPESSSHFSRHESYQASRHLEYEDSALDTGNQTFEEEVAENSPSFNLTGTVPPYGDQSQDDMHSHVKYVPADPPSPHDTEPISSLSLARAHRTNTFNDGLSASYDAGPNETLLPVPSQVGASGKSMSSQKQHSSFEHTWEDEDDELADDHLGGLPRELYKPRPSRSRSNRKQDDVEQETQDGHSPGVAVVIPQQDPLAEQPTPNNDVGPDNAESGQDTGCGSRSPTKYGVEELNVNPTEDKALAQSENTQIQEPPTMPRKRGKQKLKRGKTTSVMLNKAVDPDIEEDVIWVDEKPAPRTFNPAPMARNETNEQVGDALDQSATPNQVETEQFHPEPTEEQPDELAAPAPPPKKRGRKRKSSTQADGFAKDAKDLSTAVPEPAAEHAHTEAPIVQPDNTTASSAAPKKRGRKRKSTGLSVTEQDAYASEATTTAEDANNIATTSTSHARQPLSEKDSNKIVGLNLKESTEITHHEHAHSTSQEGGTILNSPKHDATGPPSPQKPPETPQTPAKAEKGPDKHSPISVTNKVSFRVGLSRKARIAPLLKVVKHT